MDMLGDRKFVEVPGAKTHELPPLLVRNARVSRGLQKMMEVASSIVDQEEMLLGGLETQVNPIDLLNNRKMDLALQLVDQYLTILNHWNWGDAVIEWIRQCEITFSTRPELRHLLRSDLWPHAARSSFVVLLGDKAVNTDGVNLEKAVGLRIAFRQMPPIRCCSDQFLFYLNNSVATSAYQTWAQLTPAPHALLPPERFDVQVVNTTMEIN